MVEVVMMLMLPLLAIALAVPPKRSTSALGIFVSILIVVAYHKVNQYAEQSAAAGRLDPTLGLWVPLSSRRHDLLDVPRARPQAGRAADRRARMVLRRRAKRVRGMMPKPKERQRRMINLSFFPSRRLAFYMVRLFLTRSLAVLVALVLILMTLDLLGKSGKILAVPATPTPISGAMSASPARSCSRASCPSRCCSAR